MVTIRRRGEKNFLEKAKHIDAFRRVPDKYVDRSQIGGTLSLLSGIIIVLLIYKEISYYRHSNLLFTFKPDVGLEDKIKMHVDITVATPCIGLSGVDLVDETQQEVFSYGTLRRESTWWEMSPEQRVYFDEIQHVNSFLREQYHSVADLIFKDIILQNTGQIYNSVPERNEQLKKPYDACRLHGTFNINKVAGVLHIISGESNPYLSLLDNHWHNEGFRNIPYNFTHRINKFSFGDFSSRLVQPLEGDEVFIHKDSPVFQYFIEIVPTQIHNLLSTINTYQYSVKENFRYIDSHKNSYGVPGIYFKYDWSGLKVIVQQDRDNPIKFIIRLCSIISGIVVLSGILNRIVQTFYKIMLPEKEKCNQTLLNTTKQFNSEINPVTNNLLANASTMNANPIIITAIP